MSKTTKDKLDADRDLYSGLIRLHVLHHAVKEPVFGLGMIEELGGMGTGSVQGACIRCCTGWRRRGICGRRRSGTASRCGRFTGRLRWGRRHSRLRMERFASYFTN